MFGVPVCHNGRTDKESNRLQPLSAVSLACAFTTQGLCCQQSLQALCVQNHAYKYLETIVELRLRREEHATGKIYWYMPMDILFNHNCWYDFLFIYKNKNKNQNKSMSMCMTVHGIKFLHRPVIISNYFYYCHLLPLPLVEWPICVSALSHLFCFLQSIQEDINDTVLTQESTK